MPDELPYDMTIKQRRKAKRWLRRWWGRGKRVCYICEHKKFSLHNHVLSELFYPVDLHASHKHPKVMVGCDTCGYIYYFDAEIMGIFEQDDDDEEEHNHDGEDDAEV